MVKVRCIKEFTLGGKLYSRGDEYEMPAKQATDYGEYFEKMKSPPKNKAKQTEENK